MKKFAPFLKLYTDYVQNFDQAMDAINTWTEKSPAFAALLEALQVFSKFIIIIIIQPLVLWRCWLGGRKGIRPVKNWGWGAGVVICLEQGADLHIAQRMPLSLTVSCFSKIQIGFTYLVPAHPGSPGKRAVKRVCVMPVVDTQPWPTAIVLWLWRKPRALTLTDGLASSLLRPPADSLWVLAMSRRPRASSPYGPTGMRRVSIAMAISAPTSQALFIVVTNVPVFFRVTSTRTWVTDWVNISKFSANRRNSCPCDTLVFICLNVFRRVPKWVARPKAFKAWANVE